LVLSCGEPFAAWILLVSRIGAAPSWATLGLPPEAGLVAALAVATAAGFTLRRLGRPISLDI
jgi:hypothetical protein